MELYLSLFVRSVFIENMALAFFLGMCSFIALSKKIETAVGLGIAVVVVQAITVPANNLVLNHPAEGGCALVGGARRNRSHVPELAHLHRRDCRHRADSRDEPRQVFPAALQRARDLFAADHRQLRDHGRLAVHGAAGLHVSGERRIRNRLRHIVGDRHRISCRCARKTQVQRHSARSSRAWAVRSLSWV